MKMNKKKLTKWWQLSGILLLTTGIVHTIVAIMLGGEFLMAIVQDGLWNGVGESFGRGLAVWFLVCGIFCMLLGLMVHEYIKRVGEAAPLWLGYGLLIMSVAGCIVDPLSGFWLILPQAFIIIMAKRRS
ncbi:MAG: DUF6463 family protein [Tannerellaceae bacterium]|jgi:hypothetical protein|nr:DUF6463 family protein [Tannerellaceae bacterium]